MDRDWCTALVQFSFQVLRWKCIRTPRNQANWLSFIFLNWEGGIIMDFRRMTSILSYSNLKDGFTKRIIVMLMDLWKIDLFWHKFYFNLYICMKYQRQQCLAGWTVLSTTVCTAPKYASVGGASLRSFFQSYIIAPILQWNILHSLSNTEYGRDNVIIQEFRILLFTKRNTYSCTV